MAKKLEPFNIQLISPEKSRLAGLLPVQSMDIFDTEGNYHPQGLYSTEIFGKPGDKTRMTRHGFIDMRTEIMHPKIYNEICRIKNLYKGILTGTSYAIWNKQLKDFEKSDILEGSTGYAFFMEHFHEIKFTRNASNKREQRLILIEKYRKSCMYRYLIVIPAGLRDITVEADGRVIEDEVADKYRKVMRVANTIAVRGNNINDPILDTARNSLQQSFNEIYEYIETILEGKKGFLLGKWATRVIHGGTRNVITAIDPSPKDLTKDNQIDVNQTVVGLHQYMKGTIPLTIYNLKSGPWGNVITALPGNVNLYDRNTLESKMVVASGRTKEKWGTADGIEDTINGYDDVGIRHNYVTIDDHYLGLIYMDDKYFRVVTSIGEVPDGFDKNLVRPITWTELYYFSVFKQSKDVIGYVTRYPITGPGSIYPTYIYLKITNGGMSKEELGEDWKPTGNMWHEIPKYKEDFYDSMSIHINKAEGLGAD